MHHLLHETHDQVGLPEILTQLAAVYHAKPDAVVGAVDALERVLNSLAPQHSLQIKLNELRTGLAGIHELVKPADLSIQSDVVKGTSV